MVDSIDMKLIDNAISKTEVFAAMNTLEVRHKGEVRHKS